eukprot:TRINITY_DN9433_c0_g1_i1.p2 TRINITY_DN9433_c0_g1~~TRINITY_DN9433_c0_g1_i1.p2  ORF type:complete len:158 (+),score=35.05 TRINITY_DN9433_c0_g1_i1:884-1357(+)
MNIQVEKTHRKNQTEDKRKNTERMNNLRSSMELVPIWIQADTKIVYLDGDVLKVSLDLVPDAKRMKESLWVLEKGRDDIVCIRSFDDRYLRTEEDHTLGFVITKDHRCIFRISDALGQSLIRDRHGDYLTLADGKIVTSNDTPGKDQMFQVTPRQQV